MSRRERLASLSGAGPQRSRRSRRSLPLIFMGVLLIGALVVLVVSQMGDDKPSPSVSKSEAGVRLEALQFDEKMWAAVLNSAGATRNVEVTFAILDADSTRLKPEEVQAFCSDIVAFQSRTDAFVAATLTSGVPSGGDVYAQAFQAYLTVSADTARALASYEAEKTLDNQDAVKNGISRGKELLTALRESRLAFLASSFLTQEELDALNEAMDGELPG